MRTISFNSDVRSELLQGAKTLAKTAGVTYGPHGRNVILDRMAGLLSTKDGVTVAREVDLEGMANLGCQILKEACVTVNNAAGDGTTSTAIITAKIIEIGHKLVTAGHSPVEISRQLRDAGERAANFVGEFALAVESQEILEQVAMVASNRDVLVSQKMAEACMAAGEYGTVVIEDGNSVGIELIYQDGMEIDSGVPSTVFLKDSTERTLDGPIVAVVGDVLTSIEDVQDIMETASQWPGRPLVLIAEHIGGEALEMFSLNDKAGVLECVPILAPGFQTKKKDYLKDIAALAGADYVSSEIGLRSKNWDPEWFGAFRKVVVKSRSATFTAYEEATECLDDRIQEIQREMESSVSEFDRDRCHERMAKLSGGLVTMQVGGFTEAEMKERRARIEDSLNAVKVALESGVVPGAGVAYLRAAQFLEEINPDMGAKILIQALEAPLQKLAENAGLNGSLCAHKVKEQKEWVGFDLMQGIMRDLSEYPAIIDPTQVVQSVIRSAVSAAGTLLTVEVGIGK